MKLSRDAELDIMMLEIESARKDMIFLSTHRPLSCNEVINASKRLDKLLNIFTKYKCNQ